MDGSPSGGQGGIAHVPLNVVVRAGGAGRNRPPLRAVASVRIECHSPPKTPRSAAPRQTVLPTSDFPVLEKPRRLCHESAHC